jgi:site-specific DNA-methyltransferase (adenine-specific)
MPDTKTLPKPTHPELETGEGLDAMSCYASSDGRVRLYNCEARDILPKLSGIDAIVTDPPYAVTSQASSEVSRTTRQTRETQFFESWLREELGRFLICCKPTAAWWMTIDWRGAMVLDTACARLNLKEPKVGVWDKESIGMGGILRNSYECFAVVAMAEWSNITRSERDVWEHRWTQGNRETGHPAEKPIPLFSRALNLLCSEGDTVLDPYMGGGTTGIACIRGNRRFIGVERDPDHFNTAVERIRRELAQGDLFLGQNAEDDNGEAQPRS